MPSVFDGIPDVGTMSSQPKKRPVVPEATGDSSVFAGIPNIQLPVSPTTVKASAAPAPTIKTPSVFDGIPSPGSKIPDATDITLPAYTKYKGALTEVERNKAKLTAYGAYTPPPQAKRGFLEHVGDALSVFLYPIAGAATAYVEGKDPIEAMKRGLKGAGTGVNLPFNPDEIDRKDWNDFFEALHKKYGTEFLKNTPGKIDVVDVLGFAANIFADPMTYIPVGDVAGALGKVVPKGVKAAVHEFPVIKQLGQMFIKWVDQTPEVREALKGMHMEKLAGEEQNIRKAYNDVIAPMLKGLSPDVGDAVYHAAEHGGDITKLDEILRTGKVAMPAKESMIGNGADYKPIFKSDFAVLSPEVMAKVKKIRDTWAANAPVVQEKAQALRKFFDDAHVRATDNGLDVKHLDNYVFHLVQHGPPKEKGIKAAVKGWFMGDAADVALGGGGESGKLGVFNKTFQKKRTFENVFQGWAAGKEYTTELPKVMLTYTKQLENAIYSKKFTDEFTRKFGKPFFLAKGVTMPAIPVGEGMYLPRMIVKELPHFHVDADTPHLVKVTEDMLKELPSSAASKIEAYTMSESLAKHVNNFYRVAANDSSAQALVKYVAGFTSLWKGWATVGGSPGFQLRNLAGGMVNAFYQGVMPWEFVATIVDQLKALKAVRAGKELPDIVRLASEAAVMNRGVYTVENSRQLIPMLERQLTESRAYKAAKLFAPWSSDNAVFKVGQGLNQLVEDNLRLTVFKHFMKRGKTAREAAGFVRASQFEASAILRTDFENRWLAPLIPFYSWVRGNVPYQVTSILSAPGRYNVPIKGIKMLEANSGETDLEKEYKRPYMVGSSFAVPPGVTNAALKVFGGWMKRVTGLDYTNTGTIYLSPTMPFDDLVSLHRDYKKDIISRLHPVLKYGIEWLQTKPGGATTDFETGRRVEPGDLDTAPVWMQAIYKWAPDATFTKQLFKYSGAMVSKKDNLVKVPMRTTKWLKTFALPLDIAERLTPPMAERQGRYTEPGRSMDLYIASIFSRMTGLRFGFPAVTSEQGRRLIMERDRLRNIVETQKDLGVETQRWQTGKKGDTAETYAARIASGAPEPAPKRRSRKLKLTDAQQLEQLRNPQVKQRR